jgi:hypothetical protein
MNNFPLYTSAVQIKERTYVISGGVTGKNINSMQTSNQTIILSLSNDLKNFELFPGAAMNVNRASHIIVYHQ